jgi:hypothetical protein
VHILGFIGLRILSQILKLSHYSKRADKGIEGVAQTVECLLCKHQTLSSNPSLTKREKKKKSG